MSRTTSVGNFLLDRLAATDQDLLRLDDAPLSAGQSVSSSSASQILFPVDGLISILRGSGQHMLETALVGREGMVGAAHQQAASCPGASVRVAGAALAVTAATMKQALAKSAALRDVIHAYDALCLEQAEYAIVAASRCTVEQRLARWLLMAQSRLDRNEFSITHEELARAIGVRRPGITVALHMLEGRHAIRSRRSLIIIQCRDRLAEYAGVAYHDVFYRHSSSAAGPHTAAVPSWPEAAAHP